MKSHTVKTEAEKLKESYKYVLSKNTSSSFFWNDLGFNDNNINKVLNQKGHTLFEYIGHNSIVKPYIDYEDYVSFNHINDCKRLYEIERPLLLKKVVNIFMESCNKLGCNLNICNVLCLDSSRRTIIDGKQYFKYSFHITTDNTNKHCFKTQADAKYIQIVMKNTEMDLYGIIEVCKGECVDSRVYKKTQRYRTINAIKNINEKVQYRFIPVNTDCCEIVVSDYTNYLVNFHESDYTLIDVSEFKSNDSYKLTGSIHTEGEVNVEPFRCGTTKTFEHSHFNIDYRDDIYNLLKLKVKEPTFIKCNLYEKQQREQYLFTYKKGSKCIYGNDHSRNNRNNPTLFTYERDGIVYCGCFGGECSKRRHIMIGNVLEKSPFEDPKNAIQVNERKLTLKPNNKVNQLFNQFITDNNKKVLCVKSRCGTGKSHSMKDYINKYINEVNHDARIIMLSTRQSYTRSMCNDLAKELNIKSYLDYKEEGNKIFNLNDEPRICTSLESLHFVLGDTFKPYDIVILDESESICRHIFSATIKKGALRTYYLIQSLIEYSKKVFVLDADLGNASLRLMRKVESSKFININNTYNENKRQYYFSKDESNWIDEIKTHIINGKNLFIVDLSATKANDLYDILCDWFDVWDFDKALIKLITSNIGDIDKKQLGQVNDDWLKCQVVITTSVVGAGVDFNPKDENNEPIKHFDYIYGRLGLGHANQGLSPPTEFLQICHRVRRPKNNIVNVMVDSKMRLPHSYVFNKVKDGNRHTHIYVDKPYKGFIHTIHNSKKYIDKVQETIIKSEIMKSDFNINDGTVSFEKEDKDIDFSYLQYYEYLNTTLNNDANNYLLVMKKLLERHGDDCIIDPVEHKQKRKKKDKTKCRLNDVKFENETAQSIYEKKVKTAKDNALLDKASVIKTLNIDNKFKDDDLKTHTQFFESSSKLSMYKNAKRIHMTNEQAIKERNKKINPTFDRLIDKVRENTGNVYKRIIKYSKYDYSDDFKISLKDFEEMYNKLHITPEEKVSISRKPLDPKTRVLNVLKKYGLKMTNDCKRMKVEGSENKRDNVLLGYTITPNKEVYNMMYMELHKVQDGYNTPFMNALLTYNTYDDLIFKPVKQKPIMDAKRLL